MAKLMELFKDLQRNFQDMNSRGDEGIWTDINKYAPSGLVRCSTTERVGFIVYKKYVFNFLFSQGGNNFIHAVVRASNKSIMISGPKSMEIFCSPPSLSGLNLVGTAGACYDDKLYWETFFKAYGVDE